MIRRDFLHGLSGLAFVTMPRVLVAGHARLNVGVVGGGIVGASIASHLAQAGATVTLFERTGPAKGATENSFAWINAFSELPHYRELRMRSLVAYHELDKPLQLQITWGGFLTWARQPDSIEEIRASARELENTGHPMRMLSAENFTSLAPNLKPGPFEVAAFSGLDGHLDPIRVTYRFLENAKKHGARIIYPCEVTDLKFAGNRLMGIATTCGQYSLDRLVIAGGIDTPRLASMAGYSLPLTHAPGILAHSLPMRYLTKTVNHAPTNVSFKQFPDGRVVGTDSESPPDTSSHGEIRTSVQDFPNEAIRVMHGRRILDKIATFFPDAREATLNRLTLGFRPVPEDGLPVAGFIPNSADVYVAVMHSGVTLAPIMGRYISREIVGDSLVESLAPYRPSRFIRRTAERDAEATCEAMTVGQVS